MPGETNLTTLLATMRPTLSPETYVFMTIPEQLSTTALATLNPQLIVQEAEGTTIVTTASLAAAHGYKDAVFPCKKITLTVHSSLEAVGLIAAITGRLVEKGISTNVVSGFFHDHLYVPVERAEDAMRGLEEISVEARAKLT